MVDTLKQQLEAAIPGMQTRLTGTIVALFMLAVLCLLLYVKMGEADAETKNSENSEKHL